jgi:hypothetical protein
MAQARVLDASPPPFEVSSATRLAQQLLQSGHRSIALLPASKGLPVNAVARELAMQLAQLSAHTVALVEASPTASVGPRRPGASFNPLDAVWLAPNVALIRPEGADEPGTGVVALGRVIEHALTQRARVLVDVSGLSLFADRLRACSLVDGVCVVAQARKTSEHELELLGRELGVRNLGVIVIGK